MQTFGLGRMVVDVLCDRFVQIQRSRITARPLFTRIDPRARTSGPLDVQPNQYRVLGAPQLATSPDPMAYPAVNVAEQFDYVPETFTGPPRC